MSRHSIFRHTIVIPLVCLLLNSPYPLNLYNHFSEGTYLECYRTLDTFRTDIDISRDDHIKGYCLYVLDLNPYYSFYTKRKCHCRIELSFAKGLSESVTVVMYATFPEVLYVDQARSVFIQ